MSDDQDWRVAEDRRLAAEREAELEANSYPERYEEMVWEMWDRADQAEAEHEAEL